MSDALTIVTYLILLVSFTESGLETSMSVHKTGDFFDGVHDEHIDEILAGSVQPLMKNEGKLE